MRIRKAIQLTIVVVVIVVAILVLRWYLPGRVPSPASDVTFTIALDRDQRIGAAYNIGGVPVTLLIDEEGIVRGRIVGAFRSQEDLIRWLEDVTSSQGASPLPGVAPVIGHAAPDFTLATLDGQSVTLSQLRGQWVLLNFWTTWCRYCVRQIPYLQAAFEERGDEIEFIGISWGESEAKVRQYIEG